MAPTSSGGALLDFLRSIAGCDREVVTKALAANPALAREALDVGASRGDPKTFFLGSIGHYVYAGDTALHVAAAAYDVRLVRALAKAGADVRARNRRGAEPLHYAADGAPGSPTWNPRSQERTVALLIELGADPSATDANGVAPLHRAVRTRCTGAVRGLLAGGADVRQKNGNGSTPRDLALGTTGRGGSGSPEAKAEQSAILALLDAAIAAGTPHRARAR